MRDKLRDPAISFFQSVTNGEIASRSLSRSLSGLAKTLFGTFYECIIFNLLIVLDSDFIGNTDVSEVLLFNHSTFSKEKKVLTVKT